MGKDASELMPPPMRVVHDGWFGRRELSHAEAEAWHLREAASFCGKPLMMDKVRQAHHLHEAKLNRHAGRARA